MASSTLETDMRAQRRRERDVVILLRSAAPDDVARLRAELDDVRAEIAAAFRTASC